MTKEATNRETTIVLAGLLTQAELLSLVFPLEFTWEPEGEGEEVDLEDDDGTEDGGMEGVGVREGTSCGVEVEPGVFVGGLPGTEVGWTSGFETLDGPGLTGSEVEDPPVMVKGGEMLPELPITVEVQHDVSRLGGRRLGWLTSNDIRIPVRILGRDDKVHLSRSNGETLGERSI